MGAALRDAAGSACDTRSELPSRDHRGIRRLSQMGHTCRRMGNGSVLGGIRVYFVEAPATIRSGARRIDDAVVCVDNVHLRLCRTVRRAGHMYWNRHSQTRQVGGHAQGDTQLFRFRELLESISASVLTSNPKTIPCSIETEAIPVSLSPGKNLTKNGHFFSTITTGRWINSNALRTA